MTLASERFLNRVNLRHFRLVVAIAATGSILKAAKSLNMSQPTATKMLHDLEQDLGVELFIRGNRGVVPNLFGDAIVSHGQLLLAQAQHAAQEIADLAVGAAGQVSVGTLLTATAQLLPLAVEALLGERPGVIVRVVEGTNDRLIPQLRTGDLDLIVGRLAEDRYRDDVEQIPLYDEKVYVVARKAHMLFDKPVLTFEDFANASWLLPPPATTLRRQVERAFHDLGFRAPHVAVESVSLLYNRHLLMTTDLLGLLPASVLGVMDTTGAILPLPLVFDGFTRPVGISVRREGGRLAPASLALVEHLKAIAADRSFDRSGIRLP